MSDDKPREEAKLESAANSRNAYKNDFIRHKVRGGATVGQSVAMMREAKQSGVTTLSLSNASLSNAQLLSSLQFLALEKRRDSHYGQEVASWKLVEATLG